MTVMKSLRVSKPLLDLITKECRARDIGFSEFIREAVVASLKGKNATTASPLIT